jgi:tetratricopeptide (TPR) repeat protein
MKHALICVLVLLPAFLGGCSESEKGSTENSYNQETDSTSSYQYAEQGQRHYTWEEYTEAIADCQKAISINEDSAGAYFWMGSSYYKLEQYTEAIAAYKKCVNIKAEDYAGAYYRMGNAYESLKQYPESIAAYKKYLALKPPEANADDARKRISEIKKRKKP